MKTIRWIPVACLLLASQAFAQKDPTFSQKSVSLPGLNRTKTITITSPYDDCTMTITAQSTNPAVADVTPKGPISSNTPVTFTISSGTKAGVATIIAVSLLAAFVPAWRASRIDPGRALRWE